MHRLQTWVIAIELCLVARLSSTYLYRKRESISVSSDEKATAFCEHNSKKNRQRYSCAIEQQQSLDVKIVKLCKLHTIKPLENGFCIIRIKCCRYSICTQTHWIANKLQKQNELLRESKLTICKLQTEKLIENRSKNGTTTTTGSSSAVPPSAICERKKDRANCRQLKSI